MGNTPLYLANNIFKFEAGDKLKDSELFGINGFVVKITLIKSRSNRAGQEGMFVYNQVTGYDNTLTNLLYLKNNKMLGGAGVGLYLNDVPDIKFRLSNFKEKFNDNKEFRIACKKVIVKQYRNLINRLGEDNLSGGDDSSEEANEPTAPKKTVRKRTKSSK